MRRLCFLLGLMATVGCAGSVASVDAWPGVLKFGSPMQVTVLCNGEAVYTARLDAESEGLIAFPQGCEELSLVLKEL